MRSSACRDRLTIPGKRRHELPQVFGEKRLGEGCLDAEASRDIVSRGAGTQDNDRHFGVPPATAKLAQEHFAIFDGKHQVDHHQVRQLHLALGERRTNIAYRDDGMPVLLQQDFQHVPHRGIVIENKDRLLRGHTRILTGGSFIANMRSPPTSELLSSPRMTSGVRTAALTLCLAVACAGKSPPPTSRIAIDPSDLYPLQTGNAWSYDVDTGEPSTTLAITRVEAFDGRLAQVRSGQTVVRYEVLAEGIRVPPGDAWLIRAPLENGATWPGRGGRVARVISTNATIETRAGAFDRCVEVLETGGKFELEVRTVYCAGVGPVSVDSTMRSNMSDRVLTVSAQLRGYDVSPALPRNR